MEIDKCFICDENFVGELADIVSVKTQKGINNINNCAKRRGLSWTAIVKQRFHKKCRESHINEKNIPLTQPCNADKVTTRLSSPASGKTNSSNRRFDYRTCCLFCTERICQRGTTSVEILSHKKEDIDSISFVKSEKLFDQSLREELKGRDDEWAFEVRGRVESVTCLRSEESVYHRKCLQLFYLKRKRPGTTTELEDKKCSKKIKITSEQEAFIEVIEYLEKNEESYLSIDDLQKYMGTLTESPYTTRWIKSKLEQHYGDSIVIANMKGCKDVIYFRKSAHNLLYEFYKEGQHKDSTSEKHRILKLAANLIRNDIKALDCNKDYYFSFRELSSEYMLNFIPESLKIFLQSLTPSRNSINDLTYAGIGQSIIQMVRPRSIVCPLQVLLGVEVHHKTGSAFIIEVLHKLGFCCSIKEVRNLERCLCSHNLFEASLSSSSSIPLYSADNADVQINTIDGNNTLHIMGMIRSSIYHGSFSDKQVLRKCPSLEGLQEKHITISYTSKILKSEINVVLRDLKDFNILSQPNFVTKFDALRISASMFKDVPQLAGFMRLLTKNNSHNGMFKVNFLPFIDLNPNDVSAVFTVLNFVINDAKKLGQKAVVTFDQPLWYKAMMIKTAKDLDVAILLGNFHTQMSFLSSIGYVMHNSGIKQIFSLAYAENSVDKILSGGHYTRAMRAHDLLYTALKSILMEQIEDPSIIKNASELYDVYTIKHSSVPLDFECDETAVSSILDEIETIKNKLSVSALNRFWTMYMEMVEILSNNLMAERCGLWDLYLSSLKQMLPYLAGTGRNNYTRSIYWFLQEMTLLNEDYINEFKKGLFVVRRNNTFWSGVSPDLCIEQTLMAGLKGATGLTRGRSLDEQNRLVWVLSRPAIVSIDAKMKEMTGVQFSTSEQHLSMKHIHASTISRNSNDINVMKTFCKSRYLLDIDAMPKFESSLKNIATGLVAPQSVTITDVYDLGCNVISEMAGKSPCSYSFKKSMQATQIPSKQEKTKRVDLQIDSGLLFQRILSTYSSSPENLKNAFSFELAHYPPSLFNDNGFMREASKHELNNAVNSEYLLFDVQPDIMTSDFVLDGGLLLYSVPWKKGNTYHQIIEDYCAYVRRIGKNINIVFDGYLESNTKDHTHQRRNPLNSFRIEITGDMTLDCSREIFLSNSENKQQFIDLLGDKLSLLGYNVHNSKNDADTLIVDLSLNLLCSNNVCIVADDTDIFIMLLGKLEDAPEYHSLYLKQVSSKRMINISSLTQCIPNQKRKSLLLDHAFSGCDTTSSIFGQGKTKLYKKSILEGQHELVDIFYSSSSTEHDIVNAGEELVVLLYGGDTPSLDDLRYKNYKKQLYKSGSIQKDVDLRRLPPTSSSTKYHSLRVYHQVQEWLGINLDPLSYGWEIHEHKLSPKTSDIGIAPESVLKKLKCGCKTSCNKNCSCRKININCTDFCSCSDDKCQNNKTLKEDEKSDEEEVDTSYIGIQDT